jgi:DNA-binding response OmpR family regulator
MGSHESHGASWQGRTGPVSIAPQGDGPLLLVVDDDEQVRRIVARACERAGWRVVSAGDGQGALRVLFERRPDAVALDLGMQGVDGWTTLQRIREISDVPVLMLTGRAGELEKVRALRSGADDYVTKPFGQQELVARLDALVRRSGSREVRDAHYHDGAVAVNFETRMVTVYETEVTLTPLEFRLLAAFIRHPNHVLGHSQLLELAWGDPLAGTRDQVKIYVGYLRRKLGEGAGLIETVRGVGYRYRPPAAARVDAGA